MKRFGIRATALALAVLVGLSPAASASIALGDELHGGTVSLAPGTELSEQVFWSNSKSDLRTERYISYSPAEGIYPVVVYGDKLLSRQDLSAMAKSLEAQGLRVLGGVNGDFFDLSTGNALGVIISDGVLRTTSGGYYAVGFRADGTAFIGRPDLAVTATFHGATMRITDVNKTRTAADGKHEGGLYLYTDEYSATTQHTSPGYDVILTPVSAHVGETVDVDLDVTDPDELNGAGSGGETEPEEEETGETEAEAPSDEVPEDPASDDGSAGRTDGGDGMAADSQTLENEAAEGTREVEEITGSLVLTDQLTVGGRLVCTVDQVLESDKSIQIPQGKLVLTVNKQNNQWLLDQVSALKPGDQVSIDFTAADCRGISTVCGIDSCYVLKRDEEWDSVLRKFYKRITYLDSFDNLTADVNKYTVFFPNNDGEEIYASTYRDAWSDRFTVTNAGKQWIDIMNKHVDKGQALGHVCEHLGCTLDDAMAFGDTYNDVQMLEAVGHSYVVANAEEHMHAHAKFLAPSNNDRGVAQVIDAVLAAHGVTL